MARAEALLGDRPPPEVDLDTLSGWRKRAETLLGEAHPMRAEDSPHAPHLHLMPPEREALDGAVLRLDAAAADVAFLETERLARSGRAFEERTCGIGYDAPTYRALKERVHALDARPDLPEDRRRAVGAFVAYDECSRRDRQRVGAFLDAAAEVEDGRRAATDRIVEEAEAIRKDIPRPELVAHLSACDAGPDGIEEKERKIRERIARDEEARRAVERARADEDSRRWSEDIPARMQSSKRRRSSGELKAKIALEALRGDRTLQEIAAQYRVHTNRVGAWKRQAIEGLAELFSKGARRRLRDHESQVRMVTCRRSGGEFPRRRRARRAARLPASRAARSPGRRRNGTVRRPGAAPPRRPGCGAAIRPSGRVR